MKKLTTTLPLSFNITKRVAGCLIHKSRILWWCMILLTYLIKNRFTLHVIHAPAILWKFEKFPEDGEFSICYFWHRTTLVYHLHGDTVTYGTKLLRETLLLVVILTILEHVIFTRVLCSANILTTSSLLEDCHLLSRYYCNKPIPLSQYIKIHARKACLYQTRALMMSSLKFVSQCP